MSEQPDPVKGEGDIWAELIDAEPDLLLRQLMIDRRELGIERYGTPLQRNNGRDARRDLMEELLDAMAYAQQLEDFTLVGQLRAMLRRFT